MVAEAAVVGISDELTGQAVNAFVALKEGNETSEQVTKDLVMQVRKSIGPFAAPKAVFVVDDLPKTRSGKIMRRILRKILSGEEDSLGDTSTVSFHSFEPLLYSVWDANEIAIGSFGCRAYYRHSPRFSEVTVQQTNPPKNIKRCQLDDWFMTFSILFLVPLCITSQG